jgi:hypothetical protein
MRCAVIIFVSAAFFENSYSLTPLEEAKQIRAQNDFKKIEKKLVVILTSPKKESKESTDRAPRRIVVAANDDDSLTSVIGKATIDPWGNPYRLKQKVKDIILLSAGPDGKFDSSDDLSCKFSLKAEEGAAANP